MKELDFLKNKTIYYFDKYQGKICEIELGNNINIVENTKVPYLIIKLDDSYDRLHLFYSKNSYTLFSTKTGLVGSAKSFLSKVECCEYAREVISSELKRIEKERESLNDEWNRWYDKFKNLTNENNL